MANKIFSVMGGIGFGVMLFGAACIDADFVMAVVLMVMGVLMMLPFTIWDRVKGDDAIG